MSAVFLKLKEKTIKNMIIINMMSLKKY